MKVERQLRHGCEWDHLARGIAPFILVHLYFTSKFEPRVKMKKKKEEIIESNSNQLDN